MPGGFTAWTHLSVSELVRHRAHTQPDDPAYLSPAGITTWAKYNTTADTICAALSSIGDVPAAAVFLPDTAVFHAAIVGAYRAGVLAAATGARSSVSELAHLVTRSDATVLITAPTIRGTSAEEIAAALGTHSAPVEHLVTITASGAVTIDGVPARPHTPGQRATADGPFTVDDVSYLNATSGTTGLPKLVMHTQRRWAMFAAIACRNAEMGPAETIASFVPAPYGFGLWTAHFLPAQLGRPAVVTDRFDADTAIDLLAEHRATVLGAVSTQFRMMLQNDAEGVARLDALRVMFTGGEAVPRAETERFEELTGSKVLQFYGSNESGGVSATTVRDDDEARLSSGGHVIEEMELRLYDGTGEVTGPGARRGQPAVRGPLVSPGYFDDDAANAELFTADGWLRLGDIVEVDESGRLRVVGRLADIIIRGGKNISAAEVEDHVREHPAVAMVAAVGVPDEVFGERMCAVVTLVPEAHERTLEELTGWLRAQGVTREYLPERLVVIDEMPMAAGGKIAKARVRELAERSL